VQSQSTDNPGIIAPPPFIYGAAFLTGVLLHSLFPLHIRQSAWTSLIGWILVLIAFSLVCFGIWTMKRKGTPIDPYQSTKILVISGPFRYTRNPLYCALTLFYTGLAILLKILWPLLLLPAALIVMFFGVIAQEEQYLEKKFGEEYLQYKRKVRRWI